MEFLPISLCFLLFLFVKSVSTQNPTTKENAIYPPRGWNSYASYSWTIVEQEFLLNADELSDRLLDHGYEVAMVDAYWHRNLDDESDITDYWGRPIPDPTRWPSSVDGGGFRAVANQVHRKGLKFGIHVMGGISEAALKKDAPILDTTTGQPYDEGGIEWKAGHIYLDKPCSISPSFFYVDTTKGAGKAFLRSLLVLYASWGVDFVKLDCVFGESFDLNTITTVSEVLKEFDDAIILSVSPGLKATVDMAKQVSGLVNTYRVSGNNWDNWPTVRDHFDIARDFAAAGLIGVDGLRGNSWPDLDRLPFGKLSDPDSKLGPHRDCGLTMDEQRTQMTLWTMARSPIFMGGDLRNLSLATFTLLIHPILEEIHFHSSNNMEFVAKPDENIRAWIATGRSGEVYVALFNPHDLYRRTGVSLSYLGTIIPNRPFNNCQGYDVWNNAESKVADGQASALLPLHGCALFVLNCT